jgi:hypothetical protein
MKVREKLLNSQKFEFLPKAKIVERKNPKSSARIAKYIFQIIPEPINTNCSQRVMSALGKRRSP